MIQIHIILYIASVRGRTINMHTKDLLKLGKNLSLDLFYHGYENYMQHAFPDDELNPLSCQGNNEMFGGV